MAGRAKGDYEANSWEESYSLNVCGSPQFQYGNAPAECSGRFRAASFFASMGE